MSIERKSFALIVALLVLASVSGAQVPAEKRVSDEANGYSIAAPSGWTTNRSDDAIGLVNPARTIIIAVKPHVYDDFQSVLKDTELDSTSRVVGEVQELRNGGKTIRVAKQTPKGVAVIDFFVLFAESGGGVVVMAVTDTANADASFEMGLRVSDSVRFSSRTQTAAGSSPWHSLLAGKHLLYMYSGNGYFEEQHIYLCSNGQFGRTTGTGGFTPGDVDGGSFAGRGGRGGRWSITGSSLVLKYADGTVGEYLLTKRQAGNEVGMNGKRYFVQSQDVCR
jgi:hypothetical protein